VLLETTNTDTHKHGNINCQTGRYACKLLTDCMNEWVDGEVDEWRERDTRDLDT
jgi:hypothetical protein